MKIFREVYSFNVFDEVSKGKEVYCLDREAKVDEAVFLLNIIPLEEFVAFSVAIENDKNNRFEIWKVEESEEN